MAIFVYGLPSDRRHSFIAAAEQAGWKLELKGSMTGVGS